LAVFAAASGTFAEKAVEGLKEAVTGAGQFIVTAPLKYLPLIPTGKGEEALSISTALGAMKQIPSVISQDQNQKQMELARRWAGLPEKSDIDKIGKATTTKELLQNSVNVGRDNFTSDAGQKAMALALKNTAIAQELLNANPALKSKYATPDELRKALEKGEVDKTQLANAIEGLAEKQDIKPVTDARQQKFKDFKDKPAERQTSAGKAIDATLKVDYNTRKLLTEGGNAQQETNAGQAIMDLKQTWDGAAGKTKATDALTYLSQQRNSVKTALQQAGVSGPNIENATDTYMNQLAAEMEKKVSRGDKPAFTAGKTAAVAGRYTPPPPDQAPPPTPPPPTTPPTPAPPAGNTGATSPT